MTGAVAERTTNFGFNKIDFDTPAWHQYEWANWDQLDAVLGLATSLSGLKGSWDNSTGYVAGDRVTDTDDAHIYECLTSHTSAAEPTSFAQDRIAHPTYWSLISTLPVLKGAWTASTFYNVNDLVIANSYDYAVCIAAHTSSAVDFATDSPYWTVLLPGSAILTAAGQILNSPLQAGGNAIAYVFDSTTTDADPGPGKLRLSSATQNTSTVARLDLLDIYGADYTNLIGTWTGSTSTVKGVLRLSARLDPTKFLIFNVTSIATPTGYRNVTMSIVSSSSANPFANGDTIIASFSRTGDQGASGGGSGDMLAANNLSDLVNKATARTNLGVAIGSNVQAWDADLDSIAALTTTTYGRSLLTPVDAAAARTLLGVSTSTIPTGMCLPYFSSTPPSGFLYCDGSAVSRTTNAALFAAIGTTFGSGDGSTTFNVPDLVGRMIAGRDDGSKNRITGTTVTNPTLTGSTGGAQTVTLAVADIPSHDHGGSTGAAGAHTHTFSGSASAAGAHAHTLSAYGSGSGLVAGNGATTLQLSSRTTSTIADHTHTVTGTNSSAVDHSHSISAQGGGGAHSNMPPVMLMCWMIKT